MAAVSFVEWQHAQVSTPHSVLAGLVHDAVRARVERVDRIVEGYDNEVYRILCADGQDVVIRILRFGRYAGDSTRSAAEAGAIEAARAVGVPAPEILLLDTVRLDGAEFPVMVQRAVPGRPLTEAFDRLSARQRHDVLAEIGGVIARLNGIRADDERDWQTAMAAELADRRSEREQILAGYGVAVDESYQRRLDLHTLIIALSSLRIGVDDDDQACVERSGALIRGLLAGLS